MEIKGLIYKITNLINNKIYIGQTINKIERRMTNHFSLNRKASNSIIDLAIKKYKKENFKIEVLCETNNIEDLNYLEIFYIELFNTLSPNGYNLHTGGNNHQCSEETKIKISKSKKGVSLYKLKNVPKTKEHRLKLSEAKLGKKLSKEHRRKLSESRIGKQYKKLIAINVKTGEKIFINGIVNCKQYGFNRSGIYRSLKNKIVFKNHIFEYIKE